MISKIKAIAFYEWSYLKKCFYQGFVKYTELEKAQKLAEASVPKPHAQENTTKTSSVTRSVDLKYKKLDRSKDVPIINQVRRSVSPKPVSKIAPQTKSNEKRPVQKRSSDRLSKSFLGTSTLANMSFENARSNTPTMSELNAKNLLEQSFGLDSQANTHIESNCINLFQPSPDKENILMYIDNEDSQVDQIETKIRIPLTLVTY